MGVRVRRSVVASKPKVVVIVGPTASGKTKLAVQLARRFGGEVVSADSRQVYRRLDLGTGKDRREYGRVPVHLLDVASPRGRFSVARYQQMAYRAMEDIVHRGKLPIVCGGSGLYVDAVIYGLRFPKLRITDYEFRKVRAQLQRLSLSQVLARLRRVDPATYAVIDRRNRRRVERAVEIYYSSGRPKSLQQARLAPPYEFLTIGVGLTKATLHRRIARRLQARLRQGMVGEVRWLHRQGVSWQRLDELGLEYRWVSRYLRRQVDRPAMEAALLRDIKQFARRQMVWFRRHADIRWLSSGRAAASCARTFLAAEKNPPGRWRGGEWVGRGVRRSRG